MQDELNTKLRVLKGVAYSNQGIMSHDDLLTSGVRESNKSLPRSNKYHKLCSINYTTRSCSPGPGTYNRFSFALPEKRGKRKYDHLRRHAFLTYPMVSQIDALDTTAFRARTTAPDLSLTPTALPPSTTISWTCDFSSTLPPSFSMPLTCHKASHRMYVRCEGTVTVARGVELSSDPRGEDARFSQGRGYYTHAGI